MRNYFKRMNVESSADNDTLRSALQQPTPKLKGETLEDARAILNDDSMLKMYRKTYAQYEAMRAAMNCIETSPGIDTNHWEARLGNFDLDPDESLTR